MLRRIFNILGYIIGIFALLIVILMIYVEVSIPETSPVPDDPAALQISRTVADSNFVYCKDGWMHKSNTGLWELYTQGKDFDRGVVNGLLSQELVRFQEVAFIDELGRMIPSKTYQDFLLYFVRYFNRNLPDYVSPEYKQEILGVSNFASDEFDYIGPKYLRILNYHAAHDIGHALQNMNLVGCTAFAVWDARSADSSILIGRNFDFYVGDEFSKEKIVEFVRPDKGYPFMMITWGGMIGVVSGMNQQGLTVTLNADKSEIPTGARTPVSLVAREILQYASDIAEARKIAQSRETFVSESFLIGSAKDHKVVVIEKTPETTAFYDPDTNYIILTNHFLSDELKNTELNKENIKNETSEYRYERVQELINREPVFGVKDVASVLRDQKGLGDKNIGMGNEKSINQLIAHHSIIFQPEKHRVWVAAPPYQLGEYVCYDLDSIFAEGPDRKPGKEIYLQNLTIPADTFLYSQDYRNFKLFKEKSAYLDKVGNELPAGFEEEYINTNPESFLVYFRLGNYFFRNEDYEKAGGYYQKALTKEVASAYEKKLIREKLGKCRE